MSISNQDTEKGLDVKEIVTSFVVTLIVISCIAVIWATASWCNDMKEKTNTSYEVMCEVKQDLDQMKTYIAENNSEYGRQKVFIIETDNASGKHIIGMFRKLQMGQIITFKNKSDQSE